MSEERVIQAQRTCTNCAKNEVCWAYYEMTDVTNRWAVAGFVGAGAPGWKGDIFCAFANACLEFQFKKVNFPKVNG